MGWSSKERMEIAGSLAKIQGRLDIGLEKENMVLRMMDAFDERSCSGRWLTGSRTTRFSSMAFAACVEKLRELWEVIVSTL